MEQDFYKVEAAENDFILFLCRQETIVPAGLSGNLISKLCDRHRGIGADGVIFLSSAEGQKWGWEFFNRDGSAADVCGNAARCAAVFISSRGGGSTPSWTGRGIDFRARVHGPTEASVSWPVEKKFFSDQSEILLEFVKDLEGQVGEGLLSIECVMAGVPHVVLMHKHQCPAKTRDLLSPKIRSHPALGPSGANVTWFSVADHKTLTFERGVEAETRACGSGAVAAFMAFKKFMTGAGELGKDSDFFFPGGRLQVHEEGSQFWLRGNAHIVYKGSIEI